MILKATTILLPQPLDTNNSPTFTGLSLSGLTEGSILFSGLSGIISEDNTNIFWDNTIKQLKVSALDLMDNNITNVGDIALDSISDDAGIENTLTIANLNTAYNHSQNNTQAHSDYLLNTDDQFDGKLIIERDLGSPQNDGEALEIKARVYNSALALDVISAGTIRIGADSHAITRTANVFKRFGFVMKGFAGTNNNEDSDWGFLDAVSSSNANTLNLGYTSFRKTNGSVIKLGATQINFYTAPDQTTQPIRRISITKDGYIGLGEIAKYVPTSIFSILGSVGSDAFMIFDDTTTSGNLITSVADRSFTAGHNWTTTGNWNVNTGAGVLEHTSTVGASGQATLPASALSRTLKANKWYKFTYDNCWNAWAGESFQIDTSMGKVQMSLGDSCPTMKTQSYYFRPLADGVDFTLGWPSDNAFSGNWDNFVIEELEAGDAYIGGKYEGTGATMFGQAGYDITPDSDQDADLLTVNVTGTPKLWWNESGDTFSLNKGLGFLDGVNNGVILGAGQDAKIYYDGIDLILDPDVVGTGKVLIGTTGDNTINAGAYEVSGVAGLTGTYTFGGGASGDVASMTFSGGILTGVALVP